jgi:hypothetical protein
VGLFNRSAGVRVTVTPAVVRPRQPVIVTVSTDKPVNKVTAARLEWGYDNFYRYHWAGRADSAAAAANDSLWTAGQVGTNYGGERDTDDWVCVTRVDIPLAADELADASATFTVPSWAPASSPEIARWSCRLVIERDGRDVDERGEFQVVIGTGDVDAIEEPMERYMGDGATQLDIVMPSPVWRAGQPITGHLVVRAQQNLPNADIAVYWQRHREHHPVERYRPKAVLSTALPCTWARRSRCKAATSSACRSPCRCQPTPPRRPRRCIRRFPGSSARVSSTPASRVTRSSAYAVRSSSSTHRSHARETADASATCLAVGRTPV